MEHVIIPFRVKSDSLDEAERVIKKFVFAVRENEPDTLVYRSFQDSEDPCKFIHIMTFKDATAMEHHRQTPYCLEFVKALYPLCSEKPRPQPYSEVAPM